MAIESVRVDIAQKYGIAWYKRAYFYLLRHRKMADFVFKFMYFLMPCAFKQENGRLISRFKKKTINLQKGQFSLYGVNLFCNNIKVKSLRVILRLHQIPLLTREWRSLLVV